MFGRSAGNPKWGDPDFSKSQDDEYAPRKRSRKLESGSSEDFEEHGSSDRYLITYADLITLLLGLFIILYAMSNIDLEKYKETISALGSVFGSQSKVQVIDPGDKIIENFSSSPTLKETLQNLINENGYGNAIKLSENERGITVSILGDILFPSGSAELGEGSIIVLNKLAKIIKPLPNDLRVEGHTDNVPINNNAYPSNWHLSVARATNTAYYLMNEEKISQDKVSIVGYSKYQPVATNETDEGRALNRRVDLVILNK
ncbi:MAG: OmpA family protein [Ignavibacteria bacterium]